MNPWLLIVGTVLILLLLIIFIPIEYKFNFAYHQQLNLQAKVRYGAFFYAYMNKQDNTVEHKLRILGIPLHLQDNKTAKEKKNHEVKPNNTFSWDLVRSFFHNKAYKPIGKLVGRIFNNLKPNYLIIKGEYGFFEPHNTAYFNMMLSLIPLKSPHYVIQLEPVWDDEKLEVDGFIKGSLTIAGIIYSLLLFMLNRGTFMLIKDIVKDKKHKRKQNRIIMQPLS